MLQATIVQRKSAKRLVHLILDHCYCLDCQVRVHYLASLPQPSQPSLKSTVAVAHCEAIVIGVEADWVDSGRVDHVVASASSSCGGFFLLGEALEELRQDQLDARKLLERIGSSVVGRVYVYTGPTFDWLTILREDGCMATAEKAAGFTELVHSLPTGAYPM